MDELSQEYLSSRSLIAFQIDVTHLHNVLHGIVTATSQLQQQMAQLTKQQATADGRITAALAKIDHLEEVISGLGGADQVQQLHNNVVEIAHAIERVNVQIPELAQRVEEVQTGAARDLNAFSSGFKTVDKSIFELQQGLEKQQKNAQVVYESQQAIVQQLQTDRLEADKREKAKAQQLRQLEDMSRELAVRSELLEKDLTARVTASLEEMNGRTNENFRKVEASAKAVDSVLGRVEAEVTNLRAELNTLDNDSKHYRGKIKEDIDAKFDMVLQLLQRFERDHNFLEQHISEAGRALQNPRATSVAAHTYSSATPPRGADAYVGGARGVSADAYSRPLSGQY